MLVRVVNNVPGYLIEGYSGDAEVVRSTIEATQDEFDALVIADTQRVIEAYQALDGSTPNISVTNKSGDSYRTIEITEGGEVVSILVYYVVDERNKPRKVLKVSELPHVQVKQ